MAEDDDEETKEGAAGEESSEDEEERELRERRRALERRAFERHDSTTINRRRECWFLVDRLWADRWARWLSGACDEPPGAITNRVLYVDGARPPRLRAGLQPRVHFRALNPMCWFLAVELYGRDASPEICRYSLDADAPEVPGQYREQACREPSMRARAEAQRLKAKLVPEAAAAADDEDEVVCCGCVTRDMLECMTFHLFTCCAHMRDRGPHYARVSRDDDEGAAAGDAAATDAGAAQPAPVPRAEAAELELAPPARGRIDRT